MAASSSPKAVSTNHGGCGIVCVAVSRGCRADCQNFGSGGRIFCRYIQARQGSEHSWIMHSAFRLHAYPIRPGHLISTSMHLGSFSNMQTDDAGCHMTPSPSSSARTERQQKCRAGLPRCECVTSRPSHTTASSHQI